MPLDEALRPALAGAFTRALGLALGLSAAEIAVRTAAASIRFPDAATALLEAGAHVGQVAPIAPVLVLIDLIGQAIASTHRGGGLARGLADSLGWLSVPSRVARLALVWCGAWLLLSVTVGTAQQLPYHAGALFALPALAAASVAELVVVRMRGTPPAARASSFGVACWVAGLVWFTTVVAPRVGFALSGAAVTAGVLLPWLAVGLRGRRSPRGVVALGYAFLLLGVVLDARDPALRRFDSTYTPYAELGRAVATRATDLDGDGASAWEGLDCDDADPFRFPLAADLPDDGVDQNCLGGDGSLSRSLARYAPGGIHHPSATGPGPRTAGERPDVFLVTLDATRADVFDRPDLLPETLDFVSRCIRFTRARSAAPSTGESLVALHMGVFAHHVVSDEGWIIELAAPSRGIMSTPPTLAAALAIVANYRTAAVLPAFHSRNSSFLTGYLEGGTLPDTGTAFPPPATAVLDAARKYGKRREPNAPVHVRAHLMDLHAPYLGGSGRDAYDRSARSLDGPLAKYLRELPASAIIVLAADHGEAFGEHGYREHGHTLFDEELRVPLVLCAPAELGLGPPRTIDAPVSLSDVTPTLLELTGVVVPYRRHGASLVPLLTGKGGRVPGWVYFENLEEGQRGVLAGCDKWIEDLSAGFRVLFDVCADPGEVRDLRRAEPVRTARMERLLAEIVDLDLDAFRSWRVGRPE